MAEDVKAEDVEETAAIDVAQEEEKQTEEATVEDTVEETPIEPVMFLGPDLKLIHSILQIGLDGFFLARRLGVKAEILYDDARPIWTLMEEMMKLNRLPSPTEIHLKTGLEIHEICKDPIDVELTALYIIKRGLTSQLHKRLPPLLTHEAVNDDPFGTRDKLVEIYRDTAWGLGNPTSINSREAVGKLTKSYAIAASRGNSLLGLSSPWPTNDAASLGLQPGELTVVFAKRKIGKSWIVIAWTVHMWRHDLKPGEKILFVTLEMSELQVMRRMACIDLHFGWDDLRNGRLPRNQKQQLDAWCAQRIADADDKTKPNIVFATSKECRTAEDIGALVAEHQPVCVVVDSFYILGRDDGKGIYERVLGDVQALKLDVASAYDVPVLASTQLKGTIGKDTLEADSDDAMGAKAIGDYADVTRGLFANKQLWDGQKRLFRGMEAREFKPRDVEIEFNFSNMDFSEIREITGMTGKDLMNEDGSPKVPKPSASDLAKSLSDDDDDDLYV